MKPTQNHRMDQLLHKTLAWKCKQCFRDQNSVVSKTKHSKTKTEARSTQNSKTKHPNLENEAPKTRKQSTQDSKTKHPKLENEAPKSRNHCTLKDNNFKSCMTQAKLGGGNGCVRTSKGPPIHLTEHLISRLQR